MNALERLKKHFFIKLYTFSEYRDYIDDEHDETMDFIEESYGINGLVLIAWRGEYMVDSHITEIYPSLEDLGILEECEGFMVSSGIPEKDMLESKLNAMGFKTNMEDMEPLSDQLFYKLIDEIDEMDESERGGMAQGYTTISDLMAGKTKEEIDIERYTRFLNKAVEEEDYILAAEFRDKLKEVTGE